MGIVAGRYAGSMEIVAAGGDTVYMQDNMGYLRTAKGGRYYGVTER